MVVVAQSDDCGDPVSLLLALEVAAGRAVERVVVRAPAACWAGVPCCSAGKITSDERDPDASIAAKIAQPWRWRPTMRP